MNRVLPLDNIKTGRLDEGLHGHNKDGSARLTAPKQAIEWETPR